jgi:integrating conjugative element protein (TIGR03752 family)
MGDKRINRLVIIGVIAVLLLVVMVTCSDTTEDYSGMASLPTYDTSTQADGDSTTDTIKALQAYAQAAVSKADALHDSTAIRMEHIAKNTQKVNQLDQHHQDTSALLAQTIETMQQLKSRLSATDQALAALAQSQPITKDGFSTEGLPIGLGFDGSANEGEWFDAADKLALEEEALSFPSLLNRRQQPQETLLTSDAVVAIKPVYTLPKDTTLTDGLALTALIGRIPVKGHTPDPYPVKIFIGKDNLAANGHVIPEVEGMIFSGLGMGDWNLSCVSARLFSATFIFKDGSIVNHTDDEPLGYISDPHGVPCVAGRFVSNAAQFLSQRIGLASLGAAGSAYAQAQQQRQSSSLTGTTTYQVTGNLDKLATGEAVRSASHEISRWLLERQQQSFDAVVVDPGTRVAVHLNRSLAMDYDTNARKIRYAKKSAITHTALD